MVTDEPWCREEETETPQELSSAGDDAGTSHRFAFGSLENVRKKLLDLTARNNLLSFRYTRANSLRIIDELPDQVASVLQEGKALTFIPVPEPSEEELEDAGYLVDDEHGDRHPTEYPSATQWAEHLGLNTAYDLPEVNPVESSLDRHQDMALQTLLYAPELEACLRNLRKRSETALEESGANILYLTLGYVEWFEDRDPDKKLLAPLFTMPVELCKASRPDGEGVYRYSISLKDEGLITNLTLHEKLAVDFSLQMPVIEDDDEPEAYFARFRDTVLAQQRRWRLRRHASLALLNFSKQAMYEDLAPERWPAGKGLVDHPVVARLFGGVTIDNEVGGYGTAPEHAIDEIEQVHDRFPIIYDADSSQHSALIDAVNGKNLVIEGPPGTGKSQTITNLIAASIANGKRVLFVAEKMAALNVVKDRLDRAGLGDFCLELHSHKTSRQAILQDLRARIDARTSYSRPRHLESDIGLLEEHRRKLTEYVNLINTEWCATGRTPHDLFAAATRYRNALGLEDPDSLIIEGATGDTLTLERQALLLDRAEQLGDFYRQVATQALAGELDRHPWFGTHNTQLMSHQKPQLLQALARWTDALQALADGVTCLEEQLDVDVGESVTVAAIDQFAGVAAVLPELDGTEPLTALTLLHGQADAFEAYLNDYQSIHGFFSEQAQRLKPTAMIDPGASAAIESALAAGTRLGLGPITTVGQLVDELATARELNQRAETLIRGLQQVLGQLPHALSRFFTPSFDGLKALGTFVALCEQLPPTLWPYRDPIFDRGELDELLELMTAELKPLTRHYGAIKDAWDIKQFPASSRLRSLRDVLDQGGVWRWLSSPWRAARKELLLLTLPSHRKGKTLGMLPDVVAYAEHRERLVALNERDRSLDTYLRDADTPIDQLTSVRAWYRAVRDEYGLGFGDRAAIGETLFTLDSEVARKLVDFYHREVAPNLDVLLPELTRLSSDAARLREKLAQGAPLNEVTAWLRDELAAFLEPLSTILASETENWESLAALAEGLQLTQAKAQGWQSARTAPGFGAFDLSVEPGADDPQAYAVAERVARIVRCQDSNPILLNCLTANNTLAGYRGIREQANVAARLSVKVQEAASAYRELAKINPDQWTKHSGDAIVALVKRNREAAAAPEALETWLSYARLRGQLIEDGQETVVAALEDQVFPPERVSDVLHMVMAHQLGMEVMAAKPELARYTGMDLEAAREKFKEYDLRLLERQRQLIAFKASREEPPAGVSSGRVGNYSEMGLINHTVNQQRPRVAVRSLLTRAKESIQVLKPCFMMSPMSVAQYLEPGVHRFDLVVMDEASQIRPEDALGSIARGGSLVVVGDPKQLPPTSFFQRVADDGEEDEDTTGLEQSESVLDCVFPMFQNRRLRWHYRSRHESLIAFSNDRFYNSDLVLFPSPLQDDPRFGIHFSRIGNGRFHGGRNSKEARAVVKAALKHLVEHPGESLGLVAMNVNQSDELSLQLEQTLKDDPVAAGAYERNQALDEPLFIKNLENVQGDERDVIMISMTYGPETAGSTSMAQRFGPINTDVGWRRLNVLFTRSKMRMVVFSSMDSGHVRTSARSSRGVMALRGFLEYCETGKLSRIQHTGKAADSDFEIAVRELLGEYGYECEPQLGVAGYYLDLAVRDPGQPGRFLMGIECDGATYHSAKSARDRDRLRQAVLEDLGWCIRRIWSTDWFRDPQGVMRHILEELDRLKTDLPPVPTEAEPADIGLAQEPQQGVLLEPASAYEIPAGEVDEASEELVVERASDDGLSLLERLKRYDHEVIRVKSPHTDAKRRLLRSEMVEVLLRTRPESKGEFQAVVPAFLRTGTAPEEAAFLDDVLELIAIYG